MRNLLLDVTGVASGMAVYACARTLLARRGGARAVARRTQLEGLLAPYERMVPVPLPVVARDELPPNVYRLRPRDGR